MTNNLKLGVFSALVIFISGCQSSPQPASKVASTRTVQTGGLTTQVTTRQIPVIKSKDGVQDVRWQLIQIQSKPAQFFNETPYLLFNSSNQRVQAHTGCNPVYGTYTVNVQIQMIKLDVTSGYMSCDNALAQEADLMDAFARAKNFKISGKRMQILDQNKKVILEAEQR